MTACELLVYAWAEIRGGSTERERDVVASLYQTVRDESEPPIWLFSPCQEQRDHSYLSVVAQGVLRVTLAGVSSQKQWVYKSSRSKLKYNLLCLWGFLFTLKMFVFWLCFLSQGKLKHYHLKGHVAKVNLPCENRDPQLLGVGEKRVYSM